MANMPVDPDLERDLGSPAAATVEQRFAAARARVVERLEQLKRMVRDIDGLQGDLDDSALRLRELFRGRIAELEPLARILGIE